MKRFALLIFVILLSINFYGIINVQSNGLEVENIRNIVRGGPTNISGLITENLTWTTNNSPYHIIDNTTLYQGYTITIQAGTVVKFANNTVLKIKVTLNVFGTSSKRVLFTNLTPNYNLTSYVQYPLYDWYKSSGINYHIRIDAQNGGTFNISYAKFENSRYSGALYIYPPSNDDGKQDKLTETIFENNWGGLYGQSYPRPKIISRRCIFKDNFNGVGYSDYIFHDSIIQNNVYGIYYAFAVYNSVFQDNVIGIKNVNSVYNCNVNNCTRGIYSATVVYNSSVKNCDFGLYYTKYAYNCSIFENDIGAYSSTVKFSSIFRNNLGVNSSILAKNSIFDNTIGLFQGSNTKPVIHNNFYNNSEYNLVLYSNQDYDCANNWWGTANNNSISQKIYDIWDNPLLSEALYKPYLTSPVDISYQHPVADAGPDQNSIIHQKVFFDSKDSFLPDNISVQYYWNFGDGYNSHWPDEDKYVNHTYHNAGTYIVTLKIIYDEYIEITDSCKIHVTTPPRAYAGADQIVKINQTVYFDGSDSYDPDNDNLSFKWDFGDGTFTNWQFDDNTSHVFNNSGNYSVLLTITDGIAEANDSCLIQVTGPPYYNKPPVANAGLDQNGKIGQTIYFDGSGSYDIDSDPLKYKWDYGTGKSSGWQTDSNSSFSYNLSGIYTVTLRVSDGYFTDSDSCKITILGVTNNPPIANAGQDQNATLGDTIYFDGSVSYDPDDDPLTFKWNFGDGTSTKWMNLTFTSHRYNNSGSYNVTLTVNDGKSTDTDFCIVNIIPNNNNPSPPSTDTDKDGVPDNLDPFPDDPHEWKDSDMDGFGDNSDAFPYDSTQWNDSDGDGYGDNVSGTYGDKFPEDATEWNDTDGDGYGDNSDEFPFDPGKWQKIDDNGEKKVVINDKIIQNAIDQGDIAAIIWIDEHNKDNLNIYLPDIEVDIISISENLLKFLIRGDSEKGKVVVLNIDSRNKFRISALQDVIIKLDGIEIKSSVFTTVLSAQSNNSLFCISEDEEYTQIFVYVPHFSEHVVTIEKVTHDKNEQSTQLNINYWYILIIALIVIILLIIFALIWQNKRVKRSKKELNNIELNEEDITFGRFNFDDEDLEYDNNINTNTSPKENKYQEMDKEMILDGDNSSEFTNYDLKSFRFHKDKMDLKQNKTRIKGNKPIKKHSENIIKLKLELKTLKESGNYNNYSSDELKSLLESKYQLGGMSDKVYKDISRNIRNLDK